MALTAAQRKALSRRTTGQSQARLLAKFSGKPAPQFPQPTIQPGDYSGPEFDIQKQALGRGYRYQGEDIGVARQRAGEDFGLTTTDLNRQRSEGNFDFGRTETRGNEDYGTAIENLQRQYTTLGGRQKEAANASGVVRGGTLRQAAKKRITNQAIDKKPIDTSHTRFGEDLTTNRTRFGEGIDRSLADAALQYGRGNQDLSTQEQRGGAEYGSSISDLNRQAVQAAQDQGFVPPSGNVNLTAAQRKALSRRTTSASYQRLLDTYLKG